ncbi:MAG TPA: arginase family protein [Polyangiaceae bacterium]|nr:arginase family protein [Polyangiaceae bacterium]
MRICYTRAAAWATTKPGRFAANVRTDAPDGCRVALLGLPDDTGVKLNFGRSGAAEGPAALRAALAGFGASFDAAAERSLDVAVFDAGDVEPVPGGESELLETHARVEAAARELHELGLVVVAVGGGHDLSLPTLRALSQYRGAALGGINVDAHLDVRERIGSGMPFRKLIEGGFLEPRRFIELGLNRFANDQRDWEWLKAQGTELVLIDEVLRQGVRAGERLERALAGGSGFLSIDLDGLDGAFAPGVSAKNPLGLRVEHAAELAETAGLRPEILHFDLMELCPAHDVDGRTARVAAYLFLAFAAAVARRPA